MRAGAFSATLVLWLLAMGCIRRDGRNSDCKWPEESPHHVADARHLSADAEFAEDLAIRYADMHYGLRTRNYVSGEAYAAARDGCMQSLFKQIAKAHGISVEFVSGALGRNRGRTDIAVNVPFALLYCLAAMVLARFVVRKYPPEKDGWILQGIMALFLSLVIAAASTMLGEVWSGVAETLRIENGHMSYRIERLWWVRHEAELFVGAFMIFWLAVVIAVIESRSGRSSAAKRVPTYTDWSC